MLSVFLFLALGQRVELPQTVKAEVGQFITIRPLNLEGSVVMYYPLDTGLAVFPADLLTDRTALVAVAQRQGRYRVLGFTAKGDKPSPPSVCTIEIGAVGPGPKPDDPKPPGPKPDDPSPDGLAPIPLPGLRVMIVYDSAKLAEMPKEQQAVLFSSEVRGALNQKCVADEQGNASWRIYPKVTDVAAADKVWRDAMARPRQSVPWVVISNGKTGFEGPLPPSPAAMLDLIKKYAE